MRSCLFISLLGAIVVAFVIAVGLPALAAGIITGGLGAAGLAADDTTVTVSSDPPTDLLGLHADRVRVSATDATFRGMAIGLLELTLGDVQVLERTAESVQGRLTDVEVSVPGGGPIAIPTIGIEGGGDTVTMSSVIPRAAVKRLIADATEARTGSRPTSVVLTVPDGVAVKVAGVTASGRLVVRDGDLVLVGDGTSAGTDSVILRGGEDLPVELTSVWITGSGGLRMTGDLSVGILG